MVSMQKMTATWTGFTGAPGTTSVFFQGSSIVNPQILKTFLDSWAGNIPAAVKIQVNGSGELVEPTDGKVVGTWTGVTPALITGTGTGSLNLSVGMQLRIETGAFRNGKHIRGRFYLIPSTGGTFDSIGAVTSTVVSTVQAAANTLLTASGSQIGVFHRPVYDRTVKPPVLTRPGEFIPAASLVALSKGAVLTSRRD